MSSRKNAQLTEIIRCGSDPIYFFNKYCKIQHPVKGQIPFKTYPFQDECTRAFIQHRFNIILKSRQLGLSTLTAAYSVWLTLFQRDKAVLIIATKLDVAQNFIMKVKLILSVLPKWMILVDTTKDTQQHIEFSHGSSIKAIPTSKTAGRSEALSLLIVDEAAFVDNFSTIWTGIYPTLSTGGNSIILSTPNGVGGQYYELYSKAELGENEFNPIKLDWTVNPDTDDEWFAKMTSNLNEKQIAQEYLCDFVSSGDTLIGAKEFEWMREQVMDPVERTGPARNIWVWNYPLPYSKYLISADVSRGDSKDYSTFHIFDIATKNCVAEFQGKLPPDDFANLLVTWGNRYNNAILCPENNNFGYATLMKIRDAKYENVYLRKKQLPSLISYGKTFNLDDAGFNTNVKTRTLALTKLEELIRNRSLTIRSSRFYEETKRFIWKGNKPQAMSGYNDDLVMSAAIGAYLLDTEYSKTANDNIDELIFNSMGVHSETYSSGRFSKNPMDRIIDSRGIKRPGQNQTDFSWLL